MADLIFKAVVIALGAATIISMAVLTIVSNLKEKKNNKKEK